MSKKNMTAARDHGHDPADGDAAAPRPASAGVASSPGRSRRVLGGFAARLLGWWAGASGMFAMLNTTCPFCGKPGCVAGAGASGLLGALVALGAADWKKLRRALRRKRD